jgi:general secretion pathway protein D
MIAVAQSIWVFSLCGCTLPYQQLALPGAFGGQPAGKASSGPALQTSSITPREVRKFNGTENFIGQGDPKEALSIGADERKPEKLAAGSGNGSKDGITLNLVGASIPEVAKTVLGDVLGVNYTVSDKIKATITLRTPQPLDKASLLAVFEAVLRQEGAALVVENDLYRIVPAGDVAASGAPFRATTGSDAAGVSTSVVTLRYIAAAEMERIMRSASPQAGIVRVDSARNLLMLSGSPQELASLGEIVNVFDVDWMRGMSFAIFPVETQDPEAIAKELDAVFANDKESPAKGIVRFIPNRRLRSILVITSRQEYLKKAEIWFKRIENASKSTERQVNVYRARHRPAVELAPLLQKTYQAQKSSGRGASSLGALASPAGLPMDGAHGSAAPASTIPIASGVPAPFGTAGGLGAPIPGQVGAAAPAGAARGILGTAAPGGRSTDAPPADELGIGASELGRASSPEADDQLPVTIIADASRNSLIITATGAEYRRMKEMLGRIDVSAAQILLEATVAEVNLNNDLKFGVRWFLNKGGNNPSLNSGLGAGTDFIPDLPLPVPTAAAGFQYILSKAKLQVVLNALSAVTDVNVVSSPSMMVQENKRAQLQVGDEVPIITQDATSVQVPGAPIVNSVSYRSTGVILGITPWLADDGRVGLEIEQEVSDAVATTSSNVNSPTIQQRRIKTTVTVGNGETIVLAGLMQDRATRVREQIPLLGDIPFVGNAFKSKNDIIKRTELLISITPQVIRDSRTLDEVTAEYRDKLNFSTRPQRSAPPDRREEVDRILR